MTAHTVRPPRADETAQQRAARGSSGWCLTGRCEDCHYDRFGHVCQHGCHQEARS